MDETLKKIFSWIGVIKHLKVIVPNLIRTASLRAVNSNEYGQNLIAYFQRREQQIAEFLPYGLVSNCPAQDSSMILMFQVGAKESSLMGIADIPKLRKNFKLESGEVGIVNFLTGAKVILKNDGNVEITPQEGKIVKINSDVEVEGEVLAYDFDDGVAKYGSHTHSQGVDSAGNIEQDVGVRK